MPKVPADENAIRKMLADRFGADVARVLRVGIEDRNGIRLHVDGEVPNEAFRQAIMKELDVRVDGVRVQDINLNLAGPIRMLMTLDARCEGVAAISPDVSLAVTQAGELYETATGRRINRLAVGVYPDITSMAFSPDSKILATGHYSSAVLLWDMPSGTLRKVLTNDNSNTRVRQIGALCFTPDGKSLITMNEDRGELMMWDIASGRGRLIGTMVENDSPHGAAGEFVIALSPDAKTLAVADRYQEGMVIWDVATHTKKGLLKARLYAPKMAAWSPDGKYLATGRFNEPESGTVIVWDVATQKPTMYTPEKTTEMTSLAFSPDGKSLAINFQDLGLRVFNFANGQKWEEIPHSKVGDGIMQFSTDGAVLATQSSYLDVPCFRLWDVSRRPGASGAAAKLPRAYPEAKTRDDLLASSLQKSLESHDKRNLQEIHVDVLEDGTIKLTGRIASQYSKDSIGREASTYHVGHDPAWLPARKVINDLVVTGEYGQ
jgi:dipeptidyl aminopeptidase/acylaminoacyl peptidase